MIRALLGSALPILGLGLAAAFVAPTLKATSSVKPMIVGAADPVPAFQPASFDKPACASTLLFAEAADLPGATAGLRVVALAPRSGSGEAGFELRELPPGASTHDAVVLFLIEPDGRIVAAMDADGLPGDCEGAAGRKPVGTI